MNVPPQIIKVKRRRDEDPVQALVVNKKIRGPNDADGESSSSWLSPESTIYRLQRTEGKGGNVEVPGESRLGIPVVKSTVPEPAVAAASAMAATTSKPVSVSISSIRSATPTKRKGAPESPLTMANVPGIDHTPPTPSAPQTTVTVPGHGHPPGGKGNASLLQVPQPRKYHLAHRISHKRGSTAGSPTKRGAGGAGSPKKSAVFIEGDGTGVGNLIGGAAGLHREKKRRRERKEELRVVLSRESLKEKEKAQADAAATAPSTRKRPNVNPQERKQNEDRKKKLLEAKELTSSADGMDLDAPKVAPQTKPVESSRGKDAHKHPKRDNIDNDDDALSKQLQAMVLEYLNVQDGITNLPDTAAVAARKKPLSRTQKLIGGGVGGGSWQKVDREMVRSGSARSEDDGGFTGTEDESEMSEEEGWVYDVYVREKVEDNKQIVTTGGAVAAGVPASAAADGGSQISGMKPGEYGVLVISNSDDEEWFYEGGWDDDEKSEEEGLSDDEDSNAEDYHTNDYPDEEEVDEDFFTEVNDEAEYIIDDNEVEGYLYGALSSRGVTRSDDEDDSEGEAYEKVHGGNKKWGRGGGGRRRGYAPGEEEYDLAEESESESDEVGNVKRRLERGVWGINSQGSAVDEEDSDEEMK